MNHASRLYVRTLRRVPSTGLVVMGRVCIERALTEQVPEQAESALIQRAQGRSVHHLGGSSILASERRHLLPLGLDGKGRRFRNTLAATARPHRSQSHLKCIWRSGHGTLTVEMTNKNINARSRQERRAG